MRAAAAAAAARLNVHFLLLILLLLIPVLFLHFVHAPALPFHLCFFSSSSCFSFVSPSLSPPSPPPLTPTHSILFFLLFLFTSSLSPRLFLLSISLPSFLLSSSSFSLSPITLSPPSALPHLPPFPPSPLSPSTPPYPSLTPFLIFLYLLVFRLPFLLLFDFSEIWTHCRRQFTCLHTVLSVSVVSI